MEINLLVVSNHRPKFSTDLLGEIHYMNCEAWNKFHNPLTLSFEYHDFECITFIYHFYPSKSLDINTNNQKDQLKEILNMRDDWTTEESGKTYSIE
jgi:hypothetical protein